MPNLAFDLKTHTYWLAEVDGTQRVIPSVTQVLGGMGIIKISDFCLGPERGSLVHHACALLDQGKDEELQMLDGLPEVLPYLEAWQQFKECFNPEFVSIEAPRFYSNCGNEFAGTSDRETTDTIYDIKTGAWQWGYDVQLVAYRYLTGKHITALAGVQLNPGAGAGYKLHRVDKKKYLGYWNIFQKALEIHTAKQSEGKYL